MSEQATVSINGGPAVPLSAVKEALDTVRKARRKKPAEDTEVGGIAVDRLLSIIERTERLMEERKALASDIKDIMAEAKSAGFDVPVIKQLIRIRKQEPADVEEFETLLDLYRRALGM